MDSTRPAMRLFVLHHAGGSHLMYRHWPAGLPGTWDVRLLDAPGHGLLIDLPQITDVGRLADFLLRSMEPELGGPYALFGHSMGALVMHEIARRAVDRNLPLPVWVGVSARTAPQQAGLKKQHAELSDTELRTRLKLLGGTPSGVFDNPDLWALYAPIIRADLSLMENWRPVPDTGPLPVALSAYAGSQDYFASPPHMADWEEHTEHFLGLRVFDGGHFYFQDNAGPLLKQIERDVNTALDAASTSRPTRTPWHTADACASTD